MPRYVYNKPMKKDHQYLYIFVGLVVAWLVLFNYFWPLVDLLVNGAINLSREL